MLDAEFTAKVMVRKFSGLKRVRCALHRKKHSQLLWGDLDVATALLFEGLGHGVVLGAYRGEFIFGDGTKARLPLEDLMVILENPSWNWLLLEWGKTYFLTPARATAARLFAAGKFEVKAIGESLVVSGDGMEFTYTTATDGWPSPGTPQGPDTLEARSLLTQFLWNAKRKVPWQPEQLETHIIHRGWHLAYADRERVVYYNLGGWDWEAFYRERELCQESLEPILGKAPSHSDRSSITDDQRKLIHTELERRTRTS